FPIAIMLWGWLIFGYNFVTHRLQTAEGMLALRFSFRSKISQPNGKLIVFQSLNGAMSEKREECI
ncbi:MAG: hypothetical protein KKH34_09565, partial [Candidatus Omnitrophica bacterium]|nr:hypothetical protein [Candidatus Omnitrophota bacterium]